MDKKVDYTDIIILGGGYSGITAGKKLAKKLRKNPEVRIRLISKTPEHILLTQLHEVAGHRTKPSDVQISLEEIFAKTKVEVISDTINDINCQEQTLTGENNNYDYDYLILGAGSEPNFYSIPGMEENCLTLWSLEDAKKIKAHLRSMFIAAQQEVDPEKRKELLTFVVGGGGFTGVEMMGELAEWVHNLCQVYNVDKDDLRLVIVEGMDEILPCLQNKSLVERARKYLTDELNVEILTNDFISKVESDKIALGDECVPTRTLIWTGGVKANSLTEKLDLSLNQKKHIKVNEYCQTLKYDNVYAVGDNADFETETGSLPELVEGALQTAKTAADNIISEIKDQEKKKCKPKLHGVMVSIGGNYAVADLMGIPLWGFLAMMMKHMVDIHYLWEINGLKQVWKYIKHEFSDIKGGLGIMIRHLSKKVNAFWLTILRVLIGFRFIWEGVLKIQDGYLTSGSEKLVSGASSSLWTDSTPQWYVWLMETFVVPNQIILQKIIPLTEIILGVMLLFGILTTLAALGTIGMSANFVMASWGAQGMWDPIMLLVASIVLLGGAGRAFGVDYYLIPWLFSLSKKPVKYPKHITFEE